MAKVWLVLATASGFLTVALGAFGAHSLKTFLDEYGKSIYEKAVLYQMFHTMALFAVGLLQLYFKNTSFSIAGGCFLTGIVLFSGSLYVIGHHRNQMARCHHSNWGYRLSIGVGLAWPKNH